MNKKKPLSYEAAFPTTESKAAAFDVIAERYFRHNFGSVSKTDMNTMMFMLYLEALIKQKKDENGLIDYSFFSDYKLGQALGLTPAKIRNLKLRKELQYPQPDFDWKESMRNLLSDERNLRIEGDHLILMIRDPNLFNAIRDGLEDEGGFVDLSMNTNLLRVNGNAVLRLLDCISRENGEVEQLLKTLKKQLPKDTKWNDGVETTLSVADNLLEILENVADLANTILPVRSVLSIAGAVISIGKIVNQTIEKKKKEGIMK